MAIMAIMVMMIVMDIMTFRVFRVRNKTIKKMDVPCGHIVMFIMVFKLIILGLTDGRRDRCML